MRQRRRLKKDRGPHRGRFRSGHRTVIPVLAAVALLALLAAALLLRFRVWPGRGAASPSSLPGPVAVPDLPSAEEQTRLHALAAASATDPAPALRLGDY